MKLRLFVAASIAIVLALAACGGAQPSPAVDTAADTAAEDGVREIEVEASRYKYLPDPIRVTQGERIRLKVRASDISHTFTIDELGIDLVLIGGRTGMVKELVVQKPGTYVLYCRLHRDRGHDGIFEVTPRGTSEVQTPASPT